MTNTITQLADKAIGIDTSELPKEGEYKYANPPYKFRLWDDFRLQAIPLDVEDSDPSPYQVFEFGLPEGSWSILGLAKDLTGGEMLSLIEKENDKSGHLNSWWYKNYITGEFTKDFRESFASLLKSKGLNPSTTLILLKQ